MLEETLNKALDYTRGNNTYLQCVNNNLEYATRALNNMEYGLRSDIQDLRSDVQSAAVGMYNMGLGIRDDIQTSTAMNINAIESMSMGLTSGIRASTYAIVASQEMLNQTFKQGFNSVNNTINLGLGLVGNKIDVLSEEIYEKLDEIQEIVDNPRLTASRELYRQALISYKKGFYEEALEDCLGAVEKNKTDYISWYLLGLIYLFGAGENGNVINLDKAEEAFANAAKYIKPDISESDEAQLMASEIFYHLGFTRLAKSNDYLIENKNDESNTKLLEAENASSMAYQLSKENLIAGYEYAKELHFLGKDDESLKLLEELIRKEKNFAIKAINDKNFESIWSDIKKLIERLKLEACKLITDKFGNFINEISTKLNDAQDFILEDVRKENIQNREPIINNVIELKKENINCFNGKKDRKLAQYKDIEQKDYFSVLDALTKLPSIYENIEVFVRNCIINTNNIVKRQVEEQQNLEIQEQEERRREEERKRQEERRREEERQERERQEEERIRKNLLLQRLEELELTLPSPYELSVLCSFIESHWLKSDFNEFVRNRTGKHGRAWHYTFEDIHSKIKEFKKFIYTKSESEIENMCKDIEDIPILLEIKRDWEKIEREPVKKRRIRIIIGLIIGLIIGFIGNSIFYDDFDGVGKVSLYIGGGIAFIWFVINMCLGDSEDNSSLKGFGVAIMSFIFCLIFIKINFLLVRIVISTVLFLLLTIFLKRDEG